MIDLDRAPMPIRFLNGQNKLHRVHLLAWRQFHTLGEKNAVNVHSRGGRSAMPSGIPEAAKNPAYREDCGECTTEAIATGHAR